MVIEVDTYSAIRLRYTKGESIRSISQSLGISRQTVKKYCEGNTHPDVRKTYKRTPVVITSDVETFIFSYFKEDKTDNIKKQKHTAKPQDKYLSFSAHYAFTLDFCNPAKGNEKGLKECLNTIPRFRFGTSKTVIAKVDNFSTARHERNNYFVPTRYIRKEVTVRGYADDVCILYEGTLIVTYHRSYGSGHTQYRLEHYIDLLERKSRAVFNAKPVRENVTKGLLDWDKILPGGNKEMVKLLRLCLDYGEDKILSIKRSIPPHIIPTVDIVRAYLNEPTETSVIYINQDIEVLETDLAKYGRRFGVVE